MLSIILPTYQEKDSILRIIKLLRDFLSKIKEIESEIIVIDDNSPDGTADIVKKNFPKVRVILRQKKRGLSSAVVDGINSAKGEVICVMDSDMSHPPELIIELYEQIKKGKDIAVASRIIKGGGVEEWPICRKLMSFMARKAATRLTDVKDSMSGYFMFKKKILMGVNIRPRGYKILLDILVKGNIKSKIEVPYIFQNRKYGRSKISFKIIGQYLIQLLDLYYFKIFK